jgi:protein TonB
LTGHIVFVAALLLIPTLTRGRSVPTVAPVVVDLVAPAASSPGPPKPPPPSSAPAPPPPSEPAEGVRVAAKEPKLDRKSKPPEPKPETKPAKKEPQPAARPSAGPSGPPQSRPGPSGGAPGSDSASVTAMTADDFEFAWYRDQVTAALYGQWVKPVLENVGQPYDVSVTFDILRDGSTQNLRIEQSSGIPTLDRSALRAVVDSAPFPPLPPAWHKPQLSTRFLFRLFPD